MKKAIVLLSLFIIIFSISFTENSITVKQKKKLKQLRKKAKNGDPEAQVNMGYISFMKSDYKTAISWYKKAANQNFADGLSNLGWMYYKGKGVKKDIDKAIKLYKKAAKQKNGKAQYHLGMIYYNDKKNKSKAKKWIKMAINNSKADKNIKKSAEIFWKENKLKNY